MDIVYLFKIDVENNSEELRYSLRSLKNLPHDRVFIVGEKPDWSKNINYIEVPQDRSKNENVGLSLSTIFNNDSISDDFILMNDDFFIMKQIPELPNLNFGNMSDIINQYHERYPEGSEYITKMQNLYKILVDEGYEKPLSYELHIPMLLNRTKARQLYSSLQGKRLYQFRTYYGNFAEMGGVSVPDVKIFIDPRHNDELYNSDPQKYLEKQTFLSATGGAFKRGDVGRYIRSRFTEKSEYED